MRALTLVLTIFLVGPAFGQGESPAIKAAPGFNLKLHREGATELFTVSPDGQLKKAPDSIQLQLHSEILKQPATVSEILRTNGLIEDEKTVEMLKRLNPNYDFSETHLPAGAKIDLFIPKAENTIEQLNLINNPVTFDTALAGKIAFKDYAIKAAEIKASASSLPRSSFFRSIDFHIYQQAADDIVFSAKTLESKADSLSANDIAAIQYQLLYASRKAEQINEAGSTNEIKSDDITEVGSAAASAKTMSNRISQGQSPVPTRKITVSALKENSDEGVKGLQVYVLPAGFFTDPDLFSEPEIFNFLTRFSFSEETSPASKDLQVIDARVWIGEKFKFVEMARLVKSGQIDKFQPINDPDTTTPLEIIFRVPTDIIKL